MLNHTIRPEDQSRRQVQRRFPPGTLIIDSRGTRMALVVGWGPTPVKTRQTWTGDTRVVAPRSWVAYVIEDQRLLELPWENVRDSYTIEEWEAKWNGLPEDVRT